MVAASLAQVFPREHMFDLWRTGLLDRMPAIVALLALGLIYFAAGYNVRKRWDR